MLQLAGSRKLAVDTFLIPDRPALQAPGMPVLFATANGIHLETPSEMTKAVVKEAEDKVMSLPEHERRSDALKVWSEMLVGWGRVLCVCRL